MELEAGDVASEQCSLLGFEDVGDGGDAKPDEVFEEVSAIARGIVHVRKIACGGDSWMSWRSCGICYGKMQE